MENRREFIENNSRLLRQWEEGILVFFLTNTHQNSNDIGWKMFHFSLTCHMSLQEALRLVKCYK